MTVEDNLRLFQRMANIIKHRFDNSESIDLLKAVYDSDTDNDIFAYTVLQPMLEHHLKINPTDTETTSALCELFAYCT